ncbi:MAG: hypothetical protein QGI09_02950 [Dehalococcoidia bacterium]|nr:hypothetical protein [Dehalococcoidia bacterium]
MPPQSGAPAAIRGHALRLLLATLATPRGDIAYKLAVKRAARMMGREVPTRSDVAEFSDAARRLQRMGAVDLNFHTRQVNRIASKQAFFLSTKKQESGFHERDSVTKALDGLGWSDLPEEAKEEYLGTFATATFRAIISNVVFFLAQGLSLSETANALKTSVPPSLAGALGLTSVQDREALVETAQSVAGYEGNPIEGSMYLTFTYPPPWAYRVPMPGQEQLEAILAVAEVVRLAQQNSLSSLANLPSLRVF